MKQFLFIALGFLILFLILLLPIIVISIKKRYVLKIKEKIDELKKHQLFLKHNEIETLIKQVYIFLRQQKKEQLVKEYFEKEKKYLKYDNKIQENLNKKYEKMKDLLHIENEINKFLKIREDFIKVIKKEFNYILKNNEAILGHLSSLNKDLHKATIFYKSCKEDFAHDSNNIDFLLSEIAKNNREIQTTYFLDKNIDSNFKLLIENQKKIFNLFSILNYSSYLKVVLNENLNEEFNKLKRFYQENSDLIIDFPYKWNNVFSELTELSKQVKKEHENFNFSKINQNITEIYKKIYQTEYQILKERKAKELVLKNLLVLEKHKKNWIDIVAKIEFAFPFLKTELFKIKSRLFNMTFSKIRNNEISFFERRKYFSLYINEFINIKSQIENILKNKNENDVWLIKNINETWDDKNKILENSFLKIEKENLLLSETEQKALTKIKKLVLLMKNFSSSDEKLILNKKIIQSIDENHKIFLKLVDKIILNNLFLKVNSYRKFKNKLDATMRIAESSYAQGKYDDSLKTITNFLIQENK
ncbi:hypothetical protein [Mesomycoplasma lagogenitalium]|uniref:Septation ring formation regulator n=1 Tax=Mesomycoplasma lagogenitalium TaxID=171286 RepID=A0ABY8LTT7_9BACT|nr:hypothetical protein [Mesomycoplasma lagogenitalium]WGI36654.1 hypothetical protein QEG99_04290 [Mesomycoplasma lagogenitalium]